MKKLIFFAGIVLVFSMMLLGMKWHESNSIQEEERVQKETEAVVDKVKWKKGFKKTKGEIYVPDSYEAAYNTLIEVYNERKEKEGLKGNVEDLYYDKKSLLKLISEKNKVVQQDYPPKAMLSPNVDLVGSGDYYNNIIYIPNKSLIDYKEGKNGLTIDELNLIKEKIKTFEETYEKPGDDLVEVMELECSIKQLPKFIDIFYYPRDILRICNPTIKMSKDNKQVQICNNGSYETFTFILKKDSKVICNYNDIDVTNTTESYVDIKNIDKIVYLFFLYEFIPDNPLDPLSNGKDFVWPKLIIYNVK